jgi:hypothetical protein
MRATRPRMVPAHLALSVSARFSHGLAFALIPPATGESRCCSIRPPLAQAEFTKLQLGEHSSISIITDRMHTRWRSASNSGMVQAFCRQARCCNSSCSTRLRAAHGNETRLSIPGPDINDDSLAGSNHGLGATDINSGAGNPASPGSLEDPLPIIRQTHMSSRSSLLGSPVRFFPSPKPRLSIVSRWE